jgi:hypothetical protein
MHRVLAAMVVALALLVGPAAGRLEDACLAAEPTLEVLIELVRQHEFLYGDIDAFLRDRFEDEAAHPATFEARSQDGKWSFTAIIVKSETAARYLAQGKVFRYEERTDSNCHDGGQHALLHLSAFDGVTTRLREGAPQSARGRRYLIHFEQAEQVPADGARLERQGGQLGARLQLACLCEADPLHSGPLPGQANLTREN